MFQKYIDQQYRRPSGLIGRWIGRLMADQHQPENLWTVALLDVQPDDRILEIGFGPGYAIQEVAKRLTTGVITGVDFSATMVNAARRRNAQAIHAGRVELREGEAGHLPFADACFDKVFSIHSLYFWPEPKAAIEEIRRVLKPGGALCITLLPTDRWASTFGTPVATPEFRPYSGDEVQDLLRGASFVNLRIEADSDPDNLSNYSVIGQKL
jgi:ubiquinone/menaquinone biosynthesis C-methylase UbiE